jgi:hypothetical protein
LTCPSCKQDLPEAARFCDHCGATIQSREMVQPTLVRSAVYKCGRCGVELSNVEGATFCSHCGLRFRLMTQCPSGHRLHDLSASFCSECGERVVTERFPPLRLAPAERFKVISPTGPRTAMPEPSLPSNGVASRISEVCGSIKRRIQKPKVRIIRNTDAQARTMAMYPQTLQQQMYPQMQQQGMPQQMYPQMYPPMQQQMMYPNYPPVMYPGFSNMQQRPPTVFPQGFRPPTRIVHPQGGQSRGWPFGRRNGWSQ